MRLLIEIFLGFLFFGTGAEAKIRHHKGTAKNKQGEVVYVERHQAHYDGDSLQKSETIYFSKGEKEKIASLISDYSRNLKLPVYEFRDFRSGYREGLRIQDGKYVVYYQKPSQQEKFAVITKTENIFAGQGWHYFLVDNLSILEKEGIQLNLLIPSQLDFFKFQVERASVSGKKLSTFLTISNWFMRMFAPKLKLVYDRSMKKLIRFEGMSNILDSDGERQKVVIDYP